MNIKEFVKLPAAKLQRIVAMKRAIERLEARLEKLVNRAAPEPVEPGAKKKRTMSASARKKISRAAKARWAKVRAKTSTAAVVKKRRKMSAAARKKISQAAIARWAKVRAAQAK